MLFYAVLLAGLAASQAFPQAPFYYHQPPSAMFQPYHPYSGAGGGFPPAYGADSRLYSTSTADEPEETDNLQPLAAFRHGLYQQPYDPFPQNNHRYPENHPSNAYHNHNRPTNYLPNYYNYPARNPTNYLYGSYYYPAGPGPHPNTNPYHWYGGYAPSHGYHHGYGYDGYGYGHNKGYYPQKPFKGYGVGSGKEAGVGKEAGSVKRGGAETDALQSV